MNSIHTKSTGRNRIYKLLATFSLVSCCACALSQQPNIRTPSSALPKFQNCLGEIAEPSSSDLRLAATGDIVFSELENVNRDAFKEFLPFLKQADLVLGNLEGAITESRVPHKPYIPGRSYAFRFPPSVSHLLRQANFQIISIANNHSHDYGTVGFNDTRRYLAEAGIESTGTKGSYVIREIKGLRVATIALSSYPAFNNVLDLEETAQLVTRVRAKSDLVILYYQLGAEGDIAARLTPGAEIFLGENRGNARLFAKKMIGAGAQVLIGHGPHVLRAAECIQGAPVLHSIGNFVGAGGLSAERLANVSALPELLFDNQGRFKALRVIATTFSPTRLPILDPSGRGLHLINWLGHEAQKTMHDFQPLPLDGYQDQESVFNTWLRGTSLANPNAALVVVGLAQQISANADSETAVSRTKNHPAALMAETFLGIPYRWGGNHPASGFDCSGLVQYIFQQLGVDIPRMPREMFGKYEKINVNELLPGDLVFFNTFGLLSHVGIYIGDKNFIHAPHRGAAVSIQKMDSSYYIRRFAGARRIVNMDSPQVKKY